MSKKILLADDSITIQKVISITFATEDYDLQVVSDGDAAIKKIKDTRPDLVMVDVAMPGKNGYEVCEAVKKDPELRYTPVMLLAGTFEPLNKDEAQKAGADDSIIKPFESQELLDKVRALVSRPRPQAAEPATGAVQSKPPEPKLEISEDIWEAGDFLGLPEEFEKKDAPGAAPDLGFLEAGLFEEPSKDLSGGEFMDLEIHEDELKPKEPAPEPIELENFEREPFKAGILEPKRPEPEKTEPFEVGSFDLESFRDKAKTEPFEVAPFDLEPFRPEAFERPRAEEKPFWAEPEREKPEDKKEPELVEVQEAIEEGPAEPLFPAEEVKEEFSMPSFGSSRPVPETKRPEPAPPVAHMPEAPAAGIIGEAAQRAEGRVVRQAVEKSPVELPREEIEAVVRKVAREVIEEIAWEVIPELAEELIKAEIINRFKESLNKIK